jgi:hypothetical protein
VDLTKQGRMCTEAAAELSEATERMLRILLAVTDVGMLADRVYSVIRQAKGGVVLLEQAHLDLTIAAGRPAGTGPPVSDEEQMVTDAEERAAALVGLIHTVLADCGVDVEDPEIQRSVAQTIRTWKVSP